MAMCQFMVRQQQASLMEHPRIITMTNIWYVWLHILGSYVKLRLGNFHMAPLGSLLTDWEMRPTESFS